MKDFKSNSLKVYVMTFDVDTAKEIIEKPSTNYRVPREKIVRAYAEDMKNGKWKFCGDSIKFDKDGNNIDGGHRLRAIIRSGIPQKFVVIEGLDSESSLVMDNGFKRSIEDYLKKQATAYEKGATAIVKQAAILERQSKNIGHSMGDIGLTNSNIVDIYESDEDWYNKAAQYGKKISTDSRRVLKPTEVGAIYYYLVRNLKVDEDYVKDFFFKLASYRPSDKSIYTTTMVNLSDKDYIGRSGTKRIDEFILCWNAMIHGCTKQRPQYSPWFETPNLKKALPKEELETVLSAQK